ncbi:MAG: hypothetical protein NHB32_21300 [Fischerella sp. CENA71]|nr:hypothetical protein [Fischerella sp. CENA71]
MKNIIDLIVAEAKKLNDEIKKLRRPWMRHKKQESALIDSANRTVDVSNQPKRLDLFSSQMKPSLLGSNHAA